MRKANRAVGRVVLACAMVGAAWATLPGAFAQTTEPAVNVDKAMAEVRRLLMGLRSKAAELPPPTGDNEARQRARTESLRLFDLSNALSDQLESGNYTDSMRTINSMMRDIQTPAYQSILDKLRMAIEELKEADRSSIPQRIKAILKEVGPRLEAAKTREDIEPLVFEIKALNRRINNGRIEQAVRDKIEGDLQQLQQMEFLLRRYGDFLDAENSGDLEVAHQIVQELSGNTTRIAGTREMLRGKATTYEARRNEQARVELQSMAEDVRKATTPQELGLVQARLTTLMQRPVMRIGTPTYHFENQMLAQWVRVMELEASGKPRSALMLLVNNSRDFGSAGMNRSKLVPQDLVEGKIASLQKAILERGDRITDPILVKMSDTLTQAKTLDQLAKVSEEIESLLRVGNYGTDADAGPIQAEFLRASDQIRMVVEMKAASDAREWGKVLQINQQYLSIPTGSYNMPGVPAQTVGRPHRWAEKINALRLETLREAIIQTAEFEALGVTLKAGDPLDKSLIEAADTAIAKEDYRRAALILQTYASLIYATIPGQPQRLPAGLAQEIQGLELLARGDAMQAAGDTAGAGEMYKQVLQQVGLRVPVKAAAEKLKKLNQATGSK